MKSTPVVELLQRGLNRYQYKLFAELIQSLAAEFHQLPQHTGWFADKRLRPPFPQQVVLFLQQKVTNETHVITELRRRYAAFNADYLNAENTKDKHLHILAYARDLGATPRQLQQDRKAFARWFGHDAMTDRF